MSEELPKYIIAFDVIGGPEQRFVPMPPMGVDAQTIEDAITEVRNQHPRAVNFEWVNAEKLSEEDAKRFAEALESPAEPNEALKRAMARRSGFIGN